MKRTSSLWRLVFLLVSVFFGFSGFDARAVTNSSVLVNATTYDLAYAFSFVNGAGETITTGGLVIRSDSWLPLVPPAGADATWPVLIYSAITPGAAAAGSYFGSVATSVPEILAGNFIVPIGTMQFVEKFAWRVVAKNAGSNPRDLSIFSGANPNFVEILPGQVRYLETSILWKAPGWRQMPFPNDAGMTWWPLRSFWQGLGVRMMDADGGSWISGTEPESLPSTYPAGGTIAGLGVGSGTSSGSGGTNVVNVDLGPVTAAVSGTTAAVQAQSGILGAISGGIASLISSVGNFFIDAILFFARVGDFITGLVQGTFAWIQEILQKLASISGLLGDIFAKLETAWTWFSRLLLPDTNSPFYDFTNAILVDFSTPGVDYMFAMADGSVRINSEALKLQGVAYGSNFANALSAVFTSSAAVISGYVSSSSFHNILATLTEGKTLALGAVYQKSDWEISVSGVVLSLFLPDIPWMSDLAAISRALFMLSFSIFLFWSLWLYTEEVLFHAADVPDSQTHNQSFLGINANWAAAAINVGIAVALVVGLAGVLLLAQTLTWNVDLSAFNQGIGQKGLALLCFWVPIEPMGAAAIAFLGIRFAALPVVVTMMGAMKHGHA